MMQELDLQCLCFGWSFGSLEFRRRKRDLNGRWLSRWVSVISVMWLVLICTRFHVWLDELGGVCWALFDLKISGPGARLNILCGHSKPRFRYFWQQPLIWPQTIVTIVVLATTTTCSQNHSESPYKLSRVNPWQSPGPQLLKRSHSPHVVRAPRPSPPIA